MEPWRAEAGDFTGTCVGGSFHGQERTFDTLAFRYIRLGRRPADNEEEVEFVVEVYHRHEDEHGRWWLHG